MEGAPENGEKSSHSAHASGMNESILIGTKQILFIEFKYIILDINFQDFYDFM
jgi:hypothetical protein